MVSPGLRACATHLRLRISQALQQRALPFQTLVGGSNATHTVANPRIPFHTCIQTPAMTILRQRFFERGAVVVPRHPRSTHSLLLRRRLRLGTRACSRLLRANRAMARPNIRPTASRAGAKRASTSNSRPPTGMANSKAARTTSRLICQREPAPGDEHHQRGVDRLSEQLQSGVHPRTRRCRLLSLHFPSHSRSRSTRLTQYHRRLLGLLLMSAFHRRASLGSKLPSLSQKNGPATSKSRAGSSQARKKPRHVGHLKLQSGLRELAKRLFPKISDRRRKTYLKSHGPRSIRPRPTKLQLAMLMRWTLIRVHRLCRTLLQP
jgi:hypothetical protein